ncbi:MAG: beta-ketoacyl synthase N-terminal-like domain-containing protein [Mastigocoleus sp.]
MSSDVAIIGMAGIFPQAKNLQEYWQNIVDGVDCITDVPPSRWNIDEYYDPDPTVPDKTYCTKGGFIPDINFNPLEFGLPPNILEVTDVSQLLSLVVAKQAMEDAGYVKAGDLVRKRTGVVLGVGGGQKLIAPLANRLQYPVWEKVLKSSGLSSEETQDIIEKLKLAYIKWEENSFPGMLGNVIAGRIANRLDLGGMNCVVDAACASSLSALRMALSELTEYRSDMMITGGVDTDNSIFMYMSFSKTPAFSRRQKIAPFDADSDGMLIGEGIGMMVLKRLEDAKRDGDRIYAVIKGIGSSSDGKYKSIYAPRSSGQVIALNRAYEDADFSPETVGLLEAHGTGTVTGDPTEFTALNEVFSKNNYQKYKKSRKQHIALGSIKSQIGHTKSAAGAASLIKVALALHHKILPPTININKPNPKLQIEDSPFYLNTKTRPWIKEQDSPRRAGVSSFGFGGTNYHVVLEEYEEEHHEAYRLHHVSAAILLHAATPAELLSCCLTLSKQLKSDDKQHHYLELTDSCKSLEIPLTSARVGFIADSLAETLELLQITIETLKTQNQAQSWEHPRGIHYRKRGIDSQGKVVALFSGQGSQYLEMGKELAINFPQMRQAFEKMDNILAEDGLSPISNLVFPNPVFDKTQKDAQIAALQQTENAQPAIAAFSVGLYKILQQCGFKADFTAGHSFGELAALWCGSVLSDEDYFSLVKARLQAMVSPQDTNIDTGAMVAVTGDVSKLQKLIADFPQITIANWNSHNQVVLAGTKPEIAKIQQVLDKHGYAFVLLSVSAGFHTPLVNYALKPFSKAIKSIRFNRPKIPVFCNVTADVYPTEPEQIRNTLKDHILNPVLFKQEIENIYRHGGHIFVEFGSKRVLTKLVKNILGDKPHLAIALNSRKNQTKNSEDRVSSPIGDRFLREAVMGLRVAGLPLRDIDPYQLKLPTQIIQNQKGLTVGLNGNNYVSENTRTTFEKALQNGYQIKSFSKLQNESIVTSQLLNRKQTNSTTIENGNFQVISKNQPRESKSLQSKPTPKSTEPEKLPMSQSPSNNQPFLEKFEQMMMRYYEHQGEILRVHEQYLKNQADSSQTFLELMRSLTGGATAPSLTGGATAPLQFIGLNTNDASVSSVVNGKSSTKQSIDSPNNSLLKHQITEEEPKIIDRELPTDQGNTHQNSLLEQSGLPSTPEPISENSLQQLVENELTPTQKPELEVWTTSFLEVISDKTGYPVEVLELEMDLETDLGIDSIKRVEILGAMQELFPDLPAVNPEDLGDLRTLAQIISHMNHETPLQQVVIENNIIPELETIQSVEQEFYLQEKLEGLTTSFLKVVSDKTGYPVEVLELEMDLETDLGIDSIKRVEILGAMQELFPDLPAVNPEDLGEIRTLSQIVEYLGQQSGVNEKKTLSGV